MAANSTPPSAAMPLRAWTLGGWILVGLGLVIPTFMQGQVAAPPTVEPGMEQAVKWRWTPQPSDPSVWGIPQEQPATPSPAGSSGGAGGKPAPALPLGPPETTLDYEIQKGDSLYVIAKRYGITVDQLKTFNGLKRDMIVLGQTLRIPSLEDIRAMAPPPPPKPEPKPGEPVRAVPVEDDAPDSGQEAPAPPKLTRPLPTAASSAARVVLMQSYLDRQGFSAGPIDGSDGPLYEAALNSYEAEHPGELTFDLGQPPAVLKAMGGAYTEYQLRREDFRWILPPQPAPPRRGSTAKAEPPLTLESLMAQPFLAYRTPWEFVAERYHCSESFLRRINPALKTTIAPGAVFLVPNVFPFEIEKAFEEPLQPQADPENPVTATIVGNSRLEIRKSGRLVANLPVAVARPGLRGRGTWKILDAIPRPQMSSEGDPAEPPPSPLVLPPGPNNPVGLVWIHLAKASDPVPLPYGLHGTSIPGYMRRQESIGGFRMTNWNIMHAVRLLPVDTPLTWQ